jgi:hypothetical protein
VCQSSPVTNAREEGIDELLTSENADIEQITIRQLSSTSRAFQEEGDMVVISMVEEAVVMERWLF